MVSEQVLVSVFGPSGFKEVNGAEPDLTRHLYVLCGRAQRQVIHQEKNSCRPPGDDNRRLSFLTCCASRL